jgi:exonuclease SbcD
MSIKVLHFADAHIDMANYGKRNPDSGLPFRVEDFLNSLDFIIDTAINQAVDLVIFAGDAYKDRSPVPTYQREWGRRIMRLSQAQIPTLLVVGNHDSSPALGRAHTMQEFDTLEIPFIRVIDREISALNPPDLYDLPVKVIGVPWFTNTSIKTWLLNQEKNTQATQDSFEQVLEKFIKHEIKKRDQDYPDVPIIFTAHASVRGAVYGRERTVMLGQDFVIPQSIVCDPALDYGALGHIHKPQDLNPGKHPPVIYPGSIEKIDFGEAEDTKYCILATVEKGSTAVEWIELPCRKFVDVFVRVTKNEINPTQLLINKLHSQGDITGAIVRLVVEFPEDLELHINEEEIALAAEEAFEFRFSKRPKLEVRQRLAGDEQIASLSPIEQLALYFKSKNRPDEEQKALMTLAREILHTDNEEGEM